MYRLLLYLYPASFRADFGEELQTIYQQERRLRSGLVSLIFFWVGQIVDTFGNAARIHWDIFVRDLKFTLRTASRAKGFALTAVMVTALGIGANTAVFSVVNHVLIRPLPYADSERLVKLYESIPSGWIELSPPNYLDWKSRSTSFESMGAYTGASLNLVGGGTPLRINGAMVTSDLLRMLGVKPVVGRLFLEGEDHRSAMGVALLSYGLWQTQFGGDPGIIGRNIRLNDETFTPIGVLPRSFTFPDRDTELWIPMRISQGDEENRNNNFFHVIGKLKRDVTIDQARAEMNIIAAKLKLEYPEENQETGAAVAKLRDEVSPQSRVLLSVLLGASICILLIACTNLANLFLVRAMNRRKELTVRAALGAGRERLIRQLFTESLVFAFAGTVLGILLAHAAVPLLTRLIPSVLPIGDASIIDSRVFLFAGLLLCVTCVAFGVFPALQIARKADASSLHEGTRSTIGERKEKVRSVLVIAEVMASVILLISSGLLIQALWRVQGIHPGFDTRNVLTLQTPVPMPKYENTQYRVNFYSSVLTEVRSLPEVESAGYISFLPMVMRGRIWGVLNAGGIDPDPTKARPASVRYVTPGFFETMKIPIKAGREVNESDTFEAPRVAVVSESFITKYFPGISPIGHRFNIVNEDRTIVGVVGDIRVRGLERNSEPQVYLSYRQVPDNSIIGYVPKSLVIRTSSENTELLPAIRRIIHKVDPEMPISDVRTLVDIVESETAPRVTQIRVIGAFAVLSLLLAGIGIHGLLAFAVSQRIPEIGLRIALGAGSSEIIKMVVIKGLQVAAIGGSIGLVLGYIAARAMEAILAGVGPADVPTLIVACAVAALMTISGCLAPALRAVRVNPAAVMRTE